MASSRPDGPTIEARKRTLVLVLEPLRDRLITKDRITEGKLIANGGYSSVSAAELRDHPEAPTFERVAVKKLFPQGEDHERIELTTAFARELTTWGATEHPNILPLIGFFLDPDSSVALFISPFMANGSVRTYLRVATPNAAKRLDLAIDIADALAYLHGRDPPICHGDIKPNNVVISDDVRAMLCDFGLARVVQNHPSGLTTAGFNEAGTLPYLSPELALVPGTRRNRNSDVWAFGGVLLEVLTDNQPWKNCTSYSIPLKLGQGALPASVDTLPISSRMQALFGRCWEKEPASRINMGECNRELRLERSAFQLGKSEAVEASAVKEAAAGVLVEEAVPQRLTDGLAALAPYRMSKEAIRFELAEGEHQLFYRLFGADSHAYHAILQGAFRWAVDGTAVAVTKITLAGERHERLEEAEQIARQILIWARLDDPKVYPFLGFTVEEDFGEIWVIGPWEDKSSLYDCLMKAKLSQAEQIRLVIEVAQGVRFLHAWSPPLIHGQISTHSVIIGSAGQAMIAGFRRAVVRDSSQPVIALAGGDWLYWSAPEVKKGHHLTSAVNVWLFGCLLLQVFCPGMPFHVIFPYGQQQGHMPALADKVLTLPEDLRQLVLDCWKLEPDDRPTIQQCINVLTRFREQQIQNPSPSGPAPSETESSSGSDSSLREDIDISAGAPELETSLPWLPGQFPSAEELADRHDSTLDAPDRNVVVGAGSFAMREGIAPDQEVDAQSGGCVIQ